ncbi:hypothetical protein F0562_018973 [Nyssa sinensis]|uniref:Bulb-type lectin domain-containing protein n=1 Tax=Nyssa sinensis TaxID=561372 RepID=A0A5J4ZCG4_9ASTE|nr:hypothetical protein F0562_018973 [Nyssa sinensis]
MLQFRYLFPFGHITEIYPKEIFDTKERKIYTLQVRRRLQKEQILSEANGHRKQKLGQTLISAGQIFELGFFSPGNSSKQYVGIWYKNISVSKVWVANRENPLTVMGPASCLTIGSNGNLKLVDGKQNTVWSTNVSVQSNNSIAVLSDNGMKIGLNTKTGEKLFLSSWQTQDDPLTGFLQLD